MPLLSEVHPDLKLFAMVEKFLDPPALIADLFISPEGTPPPSEPLKRLFTFDGTEEGMEHLVDELPVDKINIMTPPCREDLNAVVSKVQMYLQTKAVRTTEA